MARRKSKKPQQEDASILLESPAPRSRRRISSSASAALLFIIVFTLGASVMAWFCVQQQQSLDELSESVATMRKKLTNFQQVMGMTETQTDPDLGVEEWIFALEEAQKQAQQKAEVALVTSEKLKNADVHSQLWALHEEMDTRWAEIQQVSLSLTALQAMFKNQSGEFEAMKENMVTALTSSLALAENVAGLTDVVASACSRVDAHLETVEALNAQLDGQSSELIELKDLLYLHDVALYTNNQEMAAVKELVKTKQAMRAQALEEMLSSVQTTLDEQFFTSQNFHSSITAQLQTFHSQLANGPSWSIKLKSNEEDPAAGEFISTTAQNVDEVQEKLEEAEEEADQQGAQDGAGEEAEEEDTIQEAQPLEPEVEGDLTEEQEEQEITQEEQEEEEIPPEEQEEEEITGHSSEQEDAGKTAEEELAEETTEGWTKMRRTSSYT